MTAVHSWTSLALPLVAQNIESVPVGTLSTLVWSGYGESNPGQQVGNLWLYH